jgi:hypothetical protein
MGWKQIKELSKEEFRRLTGVQKPTFEKMIAVLREAQRQKALQGGRPSKLSLEDRLLMSLEYLGEYRTYFHIGKHDDLSESTVYKTIGWIEDTLIQSRVLSLPGRKAWLKSQMNYEVVLVDATETPIQRPQKNRGVFIQARKSATPKKRTLS